MTTIHIILFIHTQTGTIQRATLTTAFPVAQTGLHIRQLNAGWAEGKDYEDALDKLRPRLCGGDLEWLRFWFRREDQREIWGGV